MNNYGLLNLDYVNQLSSECNTNNLDELAKAEINEIGKSGIVGKFLVINSKRIRKHQHILS
jgi:hypothetical protein